MRQQPSPVPVSKDAHEKEIMMQAFSKLKAMFEAREWIMEGRGSYPYNDDRYKQEVRYLFDEFNAIWKDTWNNIESKSVEYRKKIIAEYLATNPHPSTYSEEQMCGFAEWCSFNCQRVMGERNLWWLNDDLKRQVTTGDLLQIFKQS